MKIELFFAYLLVMAGTTYLIRAVPFTLCKEKIKNRFIQSFLAYVPYAVLGAMTFPGIFYSTGNTLASGVGTAVALVLAFCNRSLTTVALAACGASYLMLLFFR